MSDRPSIAFLDFEASSLGKHSYPIEVAWVLADGQEQSYLIRPDPSWTDWDAKAEAVHGISQSHLMENGVPIADIARHMISALAGCTLYATAPSWDGKWLSKLLRAAGLPRHSIRLEDTELAHKRVMQGVFRSANLPQDLHQEIMRDILAQAQRSDDQRGPAAHRALEDARRERLLWLDIRRRTEETVARIVSACPETVARPDAHGPST